MKNLKRSAFILLITIGFVTTAQAADSSSGCGLGWSVASDTSLISSVSRAFTNHVTSATIGMTSGTSGCAKHSIVLNEKLQLHFIEDNLDNVVIEMSAGKGDAIQALSQTFGCSDVGYFAKVMRANYTKVIPENGVNAAKVLEGVRFQIKNNTTLNNRCYPIG